LGNFDQCLSIESPDEHGQPKIRGQYCGGVLDPYIVKDPDPKPEDYPSLAFESLKNPNLGRKIMEQMFTNMIKISDKRTHEDWLSFIAFLEANAYNTKTTNGLCIPTNCNITEVSQVVNKSQLCKLIIFFNLKN
jgi:hypothetical protein